MELRRRDGKEMSKSLFISDQDLLDFHECLKYFCPRNERNNENVILWTNFKTKNWVIFICDIKCARVSKFMENDL